MAIDKVLVNIQTQITELVNNLEDFVQPSVQPSSHECDRLKSQLAHLQDLLAVYTHLKHNKELSPSFNIHSKVSNTVPEVNPCTQGSYGSANGPQQMKSISTLGWLYI